MASGARCHAGQRAGHGRVQLSQRFLGRGKATSVELLPGGADAKAGGGGRGVRPSRGTSVPYVESIVLSKERRNLGRELEDHQELGVAVVGRQSSVVSHSSQAEFRCNEELVTNH